MNIPGPLVVRLALALALLAMAFEGTGQSRKPLTDGFDRLSAKERTRIAEKETADAALDTAYQRWMQQGDTEFREQRYDEALEAYMEARRLRPYNVYPKVKVEDLQALIRKREAAKTLPPEDGPEPIPVPSPPMESPSGAIAPVQTATPSAKSPVGPAQPREATHVEPQVPKAETLPPITEGQRVYMEAGAVVTERVTDEDGRPVLYKKVAHPWGQTFYFKDGRSIPEREWQARFSGPER